MINNARKTDLPVLLVSKIGKHKSFDFKLKPWHGLVLLCICVLSASVSFAQSEQVQVPAWQVLVRWIPLMVSAFMFNLLISFLAMAIGTIVGAALGMGQISPNFFIQKSAWFTTQFFRNAPWLVLLFFAMFLLPFEIDFFGFEVPLPDWLKATIGLSLPVLANVSEIVRGAVNSLPKGQWEAAESLAYSRQQTLWLVILPQCVKRMMPPWMNLYSLLTMATVLASVVGVSEVMTITSDALASEGGRTDLLVPFYSFVLLLFFIYCYPIARWTVHLEHKFAVKG